MTGKYLIQNEMTYRVPTVNDALSLREQLQEIPYSELTKFSYRTKQIKSKGEVVEEYQLVKATLSFNSEKEPDNSISDVQFVEPDVTVEF